METWKAADGIDIRALRADVFKTNLCSLYFYLPLRRETVTKAALLTRVLARGTKEFPTLTAVNKKMEELYGAAFAPSIRKIGDGEAVVLSIEYPADRYAGQNVTDEALRFLIQAACEPVLQNGIFRVDYVEQEKENLRNTIEGLINDKKLYTYYKCAEQMFRGEPHGIFEYGYTEDLEKIDAKGLYDFYQELLRTAKIDLFFSGTWEEATLRPKLTELLCGAFAPREAQYLPPSAAKRHEKEQTVTEDADTAQSKLSLGFTCGAAPTGKPYCDLLVANCIFGGSPFSKLFNNVREKMSLAYYVSAGVLREKSAIFVNSGIETENFRTVLDEIGNQLCAVQRGEISDEELDAAKKYLMNQLRSIKDSLRTMEGNCYTRCTLGSGETPEELIALLEGVTKEDAAQMAQTVRLDTVYFLKGKEAQA